MKRVVSSFLKVVLAMSMFSTACIQAAAANAVEEGQMKPLPQIEALTPVSGESPILSIDFEGDDTTLYTYADEYGRVTRDEVLWTSIENTSNGLKYRGKTAKNPSGSGITGSAFYGWLTPEKGTQIGNGYRGSRLILDNEKVQRTDKIKVSYDFAIYNIVNVDNTGVDVGMPQVVSMTSEAVESGSIPYDFNEQHYREPDAELIDLEGISRHLLTFATGRTKCDSEGLYKINMTNELGYFEPRYANDETPGKYKKLQGFTLLPNEFNFFHVDSEIDFYNNVIKFTITNTQDSTQTATITTTIPEHASWDGFIVSSQKWYTSNPKDDSDIDGKDTEHYIYLDNIKAEKLAEDVANIVTTAPEARPLIEDAIVKVDTETASTWKYNNAYDLHTDGENGYVDYSSEIEKAYDFTTKLATGYSAKGITSYTEFDFYLPKKGSYVTVYNRGSEGGGESYGNTFIISDAGICSWSGMEVYTPIYEENLECGKWYSMTVIYDHCGQKETVILKDGDTELAKKDVYSRNLQGSYYRAVWVNRNAIPRGSGYPTFYPSMATAYVANLRVYNRGVLQEFYPYGCTVAENTDGDIINADGEAANDSRLGAYVGTFTMNQVEGDDAEITNSTAKWGAIPENPSMPAGYKFTGWKLVYQNGSNASETDITVTGDSTRLKYVAQAEPMFGKIHGTVWNDTDGNGIMDENESKLPNVTVTVVSNVNPDNKYTFTTDENGNYTTENLLVGEYTVTVLVPDGYTSATVTKATIAVTEGVESECNFGLAEDKGTHAPTPAPVPSGEEIDLSGLGYAYIFGYEPVIQRVDGEWVAEVYMAPNDAVTREQVAAMLMRMFDQKYGTTNISYPSTSAIAAHEGTWYMRGLAYLAQNGAFDDVDNVQIGAVTRGEVAKLLAYGLNLSQTAQSSFTDIADSEYKSYIEIVASYGYMNGTGEGIFEPNRVMTRAEFCQMFNNVIGRTEMGLTAQDGSTVTPATYSIVDIDGHWAQDAMLKATSAYDENGLIDVETRIANIRNILDNYDAQKWF